MQTMTDILNAFVELWQEAAFWLLMGLVVAGLLKTFVTSDKLGRQLRGDGPWPAIKAALIGMPLPLCSCGVIPAAVGLKRGGASNSATTAFLISTPETGADSIAVSWALLGPFMTIIRPIAAICSALAAAMLVWLSERREPETVPPAGANTSCAAQCCGHSQAPDRNATTGSPSLGHRLWQGQRYAFTEVLGDLSLWLIVGLMASALVVAMVPHDALANVSQGPGASIVPSCGPDYPRRWCRSSVPCCPGGQALPADREKTWPPLPDETAMHGANTVDPARPGLRGVYRRCRSVAGYGPVGWYPSGPPVAFAIAAPHKAPVAEGEAAGLQGVSAGWHQQRPGRVMPRWAAWSARGQSGGVHEQAMQDPVQFLRGPSWPRFAPGLVLIA